MCNKNCLCCDKIIKTTSVSITGTAPNKVVTYVIDTKALKNLCNYCLVLCQSLPTGSETLPIVIKNGDKTIPVICKKGNTLRADQVKTRCKYRITYGNDPVHIIVNSDVCKTKYIAK